MYASNRFGAPGNRLPSTVRFNTNDRIMPAMSYYEQMKKDMENKKVCPLCRRSCDVEAHVCPVCKYAFDKSAASEDSNRDISANAESAKVCPYCLGSGTTVGGKCQFCEGSGKFTETGVRITCGYCTGTGKTVGGACYMCDGKGWVSKIVDKKVCKYCSGSGSTIGGSCPHCDGRGVIIVPDKEENKEGESAGAVEGELEEVPPPPPDEGS